MVFVLASLFYFYPKDTNRSLYTPFVQFMGYRSFYDLLNKRLDFSWFLWYNILTDKQEFDEQLMSKGMTENKPPSFKICAATSKEKQPPRNLTKPQRRFYVYLTTEE